MSKPERMNSVRAAKLLKAGRAIYARKMALRPKFEAQAREVEKAMRQDQLDEQAERENSDSTNNLPPTLPQESSDPMTPSPPNEATSRSTAIRISAASRVKTMIRRARLIVSVVAGLLTYALTGVYVTDGLHDLLFLDHTSIQDGVESCTGAGRFRECETEDGVRAYTSTFWTLLGNSFALLTMALRIGSGYLVFQWLSPRNRLGE